MKKKSITAVSLAAIALVSVLVAVAVPCIGDGMDGQTFEYRIVGEDAEGFIAGSMTIGTEYSGGGIYSLVPEWTITYSDGTKTSGSTVLEFRNGAFWTVGEDVGCKDLFTYWGKIPMSVLLTDSAELYVHDGVLYEAVHDDGEKLIVVQLTGSSYLGEASIAPHLFTYAMELDGYTTYGDERVFITGTVDFERHDATGTHVLDSTLYRISEGDVDWADAYSIGWYAADSDGDEFVGYDTIETSEWGTLDTAKYCYDSERNELQTVWYYDDFMTVRMCYSYIYDSGDVIAYKADTVSIRMDGNDITDITDLLGLTDEW